MAAADIDYGSHAKPKPVHARKRKGGGGPVSHAISVEEEDHGGSQDSGPERHVSFAEESRQPPRKKPATKAGPPPTSKVPGMPKATAPARKLTPLEQEIGVAGPNDEEEDDDYDGTQPRYLETPAEEEHEPETVSLDAPEQEAEKQDYFARVAANIAAFSKSPQAATYKAKPVQAGPETPEPESAPYIPPYLLPKKLEASSFMEVEPVETEAAPESPLPPPEPRPTPPPPRAPGLVDFSQRTPRGRRSRAEAKQRQQQEEQQGQDQGERYWWAGDARPIDQVPPTSPGPLYVLPAAASAAAVAAVPHVGVYYLHGQHARALAVAHSTDEAKELLEREVSLWSQDQDVEPATPGADSPFGELADVMVRLDTNKPIKAILCASAEHRARYQESQEGTDALDLFGPAAPSQRKGAPLGNIYGTHEPRRTTAGPSSLSVFYVNDRFSGVALARTEAEAISFFDQDLYYHALPSHEEQAYGVHRLDMAQAPLSIFLCNCKRT